MNSSNIPTDKACSAIINVRVGLKKNNLRWILVHDTTGHQVVVWQAELYLDYCCSAIH